MPRADASRRRCAIYTRKSSEEGLEQEFNSLAAQREACEAFICSQRHEGSNDEPRQRGHVIADARRPLDYFLRKKCLLGVRSQSTSIENN